MPVAPTMATTAPSFRPAPPAASKIRNSNPPRKSRRTQTLALSSNPPAQSLLAKDDLLSLIADQERGVKTQGDAPTRSKIIKAIEALAAVSKDTITTDASLLSATWRMLWTTEKEQLFIIKNAPVFGTQAGDVLQVIDVEKRSLNNVITFPPSGVFFVRSTIDPAPPQRVNFKFTSAVLRGKDWEFPLPPFGQGWKHRRLSF
ncbi:putative plastid-lipid-associated protein 11, chloroplastic [Asimina triloba]